MNVEVNIQVGLLGLQSSAGNILLDVPSIGNASSWAGSYHILSMGRHYDSYVVTPRTLTFPPIPGFSAAHPYQRLTAKVRDAGVTGNIGECVAALFATRCLKAQVRDIAHISPHTRFQKRRSPDYLMRLKAHLPGIFKSIIPSGTHAWPDWWPVESKARNSLSGSQAAKRLALRQNIAYWSAIVISQPEDIGYGLIVTFTYDASRSLTATLLLPRDRAKLVDELNDKGDKIAYEIVTTNLYGC